MILTARLLQILSLCLVYLTVLLECLMQQTNTSGRAPELSGGKPQYGYTSGYATDH